MLRHRASSDAFHPDASQTLTRNGPLVIVERTGRSGATARVLLNVSTEDVTVDLEGKPATVPALDSVWIV
jgi:hypothetical protein